MCGICGIVYSDRSYAIGEREITAMRDSLTHRGPDDAGNYLAPGLALGSRRLAVIDLSDRGRMPMSIADGRYRIVYNGEVYNYRELRLLLEARGYRFRSNSDTEVVLSLFVEEGPAMLDRLNGMFSIAIWDCRERKLFLARDRMGVKPLYYSYNQRRLLFASEEKGLFAAGLAPEFDHETWEELLCFRYVAGERTPFKGVKRLLPGHYLVWKDGDIQLRRWWNLADRTRALRENVPSNPVEWFRETFDYSVGLRRISDVPLGVLLSGGLDSSSVAASLALQAGSAVASFTVRFDEPLYDEGPLAKEVAKRWNLEFHELKVAPNELMRLLRTASLLNDEPLVHGNDLHLLAISQYAKPRVTVLLSGEGADETLAGYVRYRPLRHPCLLDAARPFLPAFVSGLRLNGRIRKLSKFTSLGTMDKFVLYNACDVLPDDFRALDIEAHGHFEFREKILAEAQELFPKDYLRQAMYSDQHTFLCSILDRNDRMTMGASIECRVPFLDYRLVEMLSAMPTSTLFSRTRTKQLMRDAIGDRLPEPVKRHQKWGFGVPWGHYLRTVPDVKAAVVNLPDDACVIEGPVNRKALRGIIDNYMKNSDHRWEALIKEILIISTWHQTYFDAHRNSTKLRSHDNSQSIQTNEAIVAASA